nr:hypothetical protein [Bacteroidota bacterium]
MKKICFLIICIVMGNGLNAQNNVWSLPGLVASFSNNPPTTQPLPIPLNQGVPNTDPWYGYYGQVSDYAHNAMQDAQGNLLFFVVDGRVYDKQGFFIDILFDYSFYGIIKGSSEFLIVPDPGNCSRYYLFAANRNFQAATSDYNPYYAILDLTEPSIWHSGRLGALTYFTSNRSAFNLSSILPNWLLGVYSPGKAGNINFAASRLRPDNSRFVFLTDGLSIFRLRITATGLLFDNYSIVMASGTAYNTVRSEMELVNLQNGNYRIAVPYQSGSDYRIYTAEIDFNTGDVITSTIKIINYIWAPGTPATDIPHISGLEFSPNGNFLYITHNIGGTTNSPIDYYNFTTNQLLPLMVSNAIDFKDSQIELGSNGRLYFANNNRLASLSNPNNPIPPVWNNSERAISYNLSHEGLHPSNMKGRYLLPDQIDGMDYTDHFFANQVCCFQNTAYDKMSYTASANATWTPGLNPLNNNGGQIAKIGEKLIIPAGRTIIIEGMTLQFAPGASLIIEKGTSTANGGNLILRGCTLTAEDNCDIEAMWNGVEVWGDQNIMQNLKQGRITIDNSLIERAHIGVSLFKRTPTIDESFTGGRIVARNSTFKNNSVDVHFKRYAFPNSSTFTLCEFLTTEVITNGLDAHIKMESVQGISFRGNLFENQAINSPPYSFILDRGRGIVSINSRFSVNEYCSVTLPLGTLCSSANKTPNTFRNLTFGIYAWSSNGFNTVSIRGNNFINLPYGIYLGNQLFADVSYNNFEIAFGVKSSSYGLYLDASSKYKVTENNFTSSMIIAQTTGIVVQNTYGSPYINSSVHDNMIYKNYFQNLYVGGQSQGRNATNQYSSCSTAQPQGYGLVWKCNEFTQLIHRADLAVTSGAIWYHQGNYTNPAGNSFSHTPFYDDNDISRNLDAGCFHYYHHP